MIASEVKAFFESLIDDTWDDVATYTLMQSVEEKLEGEREWVVLRTLDTSITVNTATTWQTAKTLPARFLSARKVYVGSNTGEPLIECSYENLMQYKDIPGYFAIDYATGNIYFSGTFSQTYTIYLWYKRGMETIEDGTETFPWLGNRATVVAFRMAEAHKGGVDGDEINFQMSPEQRALYRETYNSLIQLDVSQQLKGMGN